MSATRSGSQQGSELRGRTSSRGSGSGPGGRSSSRIRNESQMAMARSLQPVVEEPKLDYRKLDLPSNAYRAITGSTEVDHKCIPRPATGNTTGQTFMCPVNMHKVLEKPKRPIYQYDVLIGSGVEKRGLLMAVWKCPSIQKLVGGWIWNGDRMAWSLKKVNDLNLQIDMDKEKDHELVPRKVRPGGDSALHSRGPRPDNIIRVQIRQTTVVDLSNVDMYLAGKMDFDNGHLASIMFYDALLRAGPSETLIPIKRGFFERSRPNRVQIGGGAEACKGLYQSLRMADGGNLLVNCDVQNTVFWQGGVNLKDVVVQMVGCEEREIEHRIKKTAKVLGDVPRDNNYMMNLRKLKKVRVRVRYNNMNEALKDRPFTIKDFMYQTAANMLIKIRNDKGVEEEVLLKDYFEKKYDHIIPNPHLPVVEMTKKGVYYPMDCCVILPAQKYPFKLTETQTANMIKFAVTRPPVRAQHIKEVLDKINWAQDRYLKHYGLSVSKNMLECRARLLTAPIVQFAGNKTVKPGTSGRWRIDGTQFLTPNKDVLTSWGVICVNDIGRDKLNEENVQHFVRVFINTYKGHGGKVTNYNPISEFCNAKDIATVISEMFNKISNKTGRAQLMLVMVSGKDAFVYNRIKKSLDCRWGVVSQVILNFHAKKAAPQYVSNVCLKINAKLGGSTARVVNLKDKTGGMFGCPTMIIGADVSHPGAGSLAPSMCAMTVSMDRLATRFAAACQSNGHRVEMIATWNINDIMGPLIKHWMKEVGGNSIPQHVMYFRDGISEGQYSKCLNEEIRDLKGIFKDVDTSAGNKKFLDCKFTVVVASKRHHIRFFPKPGVGADKNGNVHPGTLVEKDITHPFEYDFYLNSHSALQGTARPTHYHVLLDEKKMSATHLQNLIYESCYTYARSTTPVSIFPAIYYAHLASKRAVAHENISSAAGPHKSTEELERASLLKIKAISDETGKRMNASAVKRLKELTEAEYPPLLRMNNEGGITTAMWYI